MMDAQSCGSYGKRSNGRHSKRRVGMTALTVLAGFLGGMSASVLLVPPAARAVTPYMPGSTLETPLPAMAAVNVPPGGIEYRTPAGQVVARLQADEQGGRYEILNRQGVTVARLSASANGGGNLTLYNRSGQPIFSASGD